MNIYHNIKSSFSDNLAIVVKHFCCGFDEVLICCVFQGELLTKGANIDDYKVSIGFGQCTVTDLFDNLILCKPPTIEPGVNRSGHFKEGEPRLYVRNITILA